MDVIYRFQDIEFEWDSGKAQINVTKHDITFEEATEAFFDPFYQTGDASVDDDERRDFILGYSLSVRLLLVVHTERGERTRIISARLATRDERKLYERS